MNCLEVFDKNLQRIGYLPTATNVQRRRRINSDYELSFLVPMESEDYTEKIVPKGHVMDERGQYYVINTRKRDRNGKKRMAVISCMHIMFKMADFKMPYASYIDEGFGVSILTLTNTISAATNGKFTFSIDSVFDVKDIKDWGRGNTLQALNQLITIYGCEVDADNFIIHLKSQIGNPNSDLQYRLKKNIISDTFSDDVRVLVTRMYSQMKDGLTFIDLPASNLTTEEFDLLNAVPGAIVGGLIKVNYLISPYAASWANTTNTYYDGEFIDQNLEDPLELLEATRQALRKQEVPQLDITINPVDLHKINHEEPEPHLGDSVKCIDPGLEMNSIDARIADLTEYLFELDKHASVNLANFMKRDYEDIIADLDKSKRIVDGIMSGGSVRVGAFEAFARQAVIDINNSKTELIYPIAGGILAQDPLNPLKQVRLTSAGLGISTDGWNTVRSAITADGIAAPYVVGLLGEFAQVKTDNIIAGTAKITSAMIDSINTNQINVGTLTGFTIQTGSSGARIVMNSSDFRTYDSGGVNRISLSNSTTTFGLAGIEFRNASGVAQGVLTGDTGLRLVASTTGSDITISTGFGDVIIAGQVIDLQGSILDCSSITTFLGNFVLPSSVSIGSVDSTEISYLNGVTSAIQTQLNGKAATTHSLSSHSGTYSDVSGLPAALTAKADLNSATLTGTPRSTTPLFSLFDTRIATMAAVVGAGNGGIKTINYINWGPVGLVFWATDGTNETVLFD